MKQEHKDFLEANIGNYHTIQNGYVRNLDIYLLNMYEHIYRENLDSQFVLTKWCSSCVMETLKRLYEYYLSLPQEVVQNLVQDTPEILVNSTKKKGRPKRNENTSSNPEA
jgi:hypothetical protein